MVGRLSILPQPVSRVRPQEYIDYMWVFSFRMKPSVRYRRLTNPPQWRKPNASIVYYAGLIVGNKPPSRDCDFLLSCAASSSIFFGSRPLPDSSERPDASADRGDIRGLPETGGRTPGTSIGLGGGVMSAMTGALTFDARHHRIHLRVRWSSHDYSDITGRRDEPRPK